MKEKQGTIAKLGLTLIKAVRRSKRAPQLPSAVDADDKEEPGNGPDDRPREREGQEIVPLPHLS
jgi:hypothetical protein